MRAMPRAFPSSAIGGPLRAGMRAGGRNPVAAKYPRHRAHGALLRRQSAHRARTSGLPQLSTRGGPI